MLGNGAAMDAIEPQLATAAVTIKTTLSTIIADPMRETLTFTDYVSIK